MRSAVVWLSVLLNLVLIGALVSIGRGRPSAVRPPLVTVDSRFGAFALRSYGDSEVGQPPDRPHISFDCGAMAGRYAGSEEGERIVSSKSDHRLAVTIAAPPRAIMASCVLSHYPINVFSSDLATSEHELQIIALEIEGAVLAACMRD